MGGDVGEIERFFHCRIAAADDGHRLVAVEKTVAGGASGHAAALESLLGAEPQITAEAPVAMISASQV